MKTGHPILEPRFAWRGRAFASDDWLKIKEWARSRPHPDRQESIEIQANLLAARLIPPDGGLDVDRQFRAPHHSISPAGITSELEIAQHGTFVIRDPLEWPRASLDQVMVGAEEDLTVWIGVKAWSGQESERLLMGPLGDIFQDRRFAEVVWWAEELVEMLWKLNERVHAEVVTDTAFVAPYSLYPMYEIYEMAKLMLDEDTHWKIRTAAARLNLAEQAVMKFSFLVWIGRRVAELEAIASIGRVGQPSLLLVDVTEGDARKIHEAIDSKMLDDDPREYMLEAWPKNLPSRPATSTMTDLYFSAGEAPIVQAAIDRILNRGDKLENTRQILPWSRTPF